MYVYILAPNDDYRNKGIEIGSSLTRVNIWNLGRKFCWQPLLYGSNHLYMEATIDIWKQPPIYGQNTNKTADFRRHFELPYNFIHCINSF